MKRRTFVAGATATGMSLVSGAVALAQEDAGTATPAAGSEAKTPAGVESGFAPVNGLQLYYEIHGGGEPLVLLHPAYGTISLWGPVLESLAQGHQVIAVELQGHGRTADINRPLSYEQMADDTAALMDFLGIAQADIVGYSMGANVGIRLAIQHPDLVRKLVVISGNTRLDAYYPEVLATIQEITPATFAGTPFETAYLEVAPNPDNWPVLIEKLKDLDAQEFDWSDEVAAMKAPTLIMLGDSDVMRPEHGVEFFRLLGGGVPGDLVGLPMSQLAILPGTTHLTIMFERFELPLSMIAEFLAAPMPEAG
jgi:pimeloyl-ACP methyl ester carboxylesterase